MRLAMHEVRRGLLLFPVVLWLGIGGPASYAWAAPKAWLINEDGDAVKLDLTQLAFTEPIDLETVWIQVNEVAVDRARGNVFAPHGRGPYQVSVFDLKTLKRKGKLGFEVDDAPTGSAGPIQFVFPPTGGTVFARRWNPEVKDAPKAVELIGIDATTFEAAAPRTTSPPLAERLMLDPVGRRLYSMTARKPARIDVFDLPAFMHASTVDLEAFVNPKAFGRSIFDFGQGKILIGENEKAQTSDPSRYALFVFDVASDRITPKIHTGTVGDAALLPRTGRLLFNEKKVVHQAGPGGRTASGLVATGRVLVSDTSTGNLLATVQVPLDPGVQWGRILEVGPDEDVLYYLVPRPGRRTPKLAVVSLREFSVVKELVLPLNLSRMIVFDE